MIANRIRLRAPGCTMAASLDGGLTQLRRQRAAGVLGVHGAPEARPADFRVASGTWVQVYRQNMTDSTAFAAPEACTLPLVDHPLRLVEFDTLFADGLTTQQRQSPTVLRWTLDPEVERTARDLTARETACCSFFTFDFAIGADTVQLDVTVPPAQVEVMDALAARASAGLAAT
jgi:hypothetical protein